MDKEELILSKCTWVNNGKIFGYLSLIDANYLVMTKRYLFYDCCAWGYIVEKALNTWGTKQTVM